MTDEITRTTLEHDVMRRTRQMLASSKWQRQYATAMFSLVVSDMAADLEKLLQAQYLYPGDAGHLQETIDFLEKKIRDEYRRLFGCDMG